MCRVYRAAGVAAWSHILPEQVLQDMTAPARWHPTTGVEMLVAESVGVVLGFTCLRPSGDQDAGPEVGEVDAFYTDPQIWGRGVGRALLSEAVTRFKSRGCQSATLWTEWRNERPLKIYQTSGWQLDGAERDRNYRGTDIRELRLRIDLR
jgi:GNAT superfamily N-acetyltransferase